ncbi:NupC/NupG family nucleoside CNT transporter [Zymobacter sp. IVIA_12111.31 C1]|uniref:NupC/NupG family nucleoside CNT transporter n=1 Tax=Zymobacter sp. IVIA_12111.31 C1 TaxID=3394854 RepID=UPI0039C0A764
MKFAVAILSLLVILGLAYAFSSDRKQVRPGPVLLLLAIQIVLAFVLLKTTVGATVIQGFAGMFEKLMSCAHEGIAFVFGGLVPDPSSNSYTFIFFFNVLLPIIFVSTLIGILQHIKLLPFLMKATGKLISLISGQGKLESYNSIASPILGQSEVFISMKRQLPFLSRQRLYTLCATAMSTVSMSTVGSYMTIMNGITDKAQMGATTGATFVVVALVLNLFGSIIVVSLINPYKVSAEEDNLQVELHHNQSLFEMLGEYIIDGFKIAIIIAAMMIGYIALLKLLDRSVFFLLSHADMLLHSAFNVDPRTYIDPQTHIIPHITFTQILGYLFSPLAMLVGVDVNEAANAGSIMATKLVSNEFTAMLQLQNSGSLSAHTIGVISVFLISFANFSSVGVIVGAIKALNEKQSTVAARFGLKLLFGATLVSLLSATIAGLFM